MDDSTHRDDIHLLCNPFILLHICIPLKPGTALDILKAPSAPDTVINIRAQHAVFFYQAAANPKRSIEEPYARFQFEFLDQSI